jgi:hypothetical protein
MNKWLLLVCMAIGASAGAQESFQQRQEARKKAERERIDAALAVGRVGFRLEDWRWIKSELVARVRLQNNMTAIAKDFKVSCATYNRAGAALSPARVVVYRQLKPGERGNYEINFRRVNSQIATLSCTVDDWRTF